MKSDVYFIDFKASVRRNLLERYGDLLVSAGFALIAQKNKLLAIKIHFGELGNTAYLRPYFARKAAEEAIKRGAIPYLTDCNTLYVGSRGRAPEHLRTAFLNGYDFLSAGCPIIIADGVRGDTEEILHLEQNDGLKDYYIGSEVLKADGLLVLSHFKLHEQTGFGGAIKNLGMGAASRRGKLAMHSGATPTIESSRCTGCASCERWCATGAIRVKNGIAEISAKTCIGCGQCIVSCPQSAVDADWNASTENLNKLMAEYCLSITERYRDRVVFVNVINQVSPACDCWSYSDAPIIPDIGILASSDPVALDAASADMVNASEGLPNSALGSTTAAGTDKFAMLYPKINWKTQLIHGQKIGLGNTNYNLIRLK